MKKLLKILIIPLLHLIRRIIEVIRRIIEVISFHAIPSTPKLSVDKKNSVYKYYTEDEIRDSYNHFKKYFHDIFFDLRINLRNYAIKKALSNHKSGFYYIEFGVLKGISINQFSEILKDITIYGFDSFEGLKEDWKGGYVGKWHKSWDLNKQPPQLNNNCVPIIGWIQDTLPKFISERKDLKINFVHIDTDTYPTARFILQQIKPYLVDGAIIIFDELYNFPGWRVGEYKALTESFKEEEYEYLAFAMEGESVVIQYKKIVK